MQITQIKDLGIITAALPASRDFYVGLLGFQPIYVSPQYIQMKNGPVELGLMAETPEAPAVPANGAWLSLGVESADAEYARLQAAGATLDAPPEDKPWGERCFVVRDPNGYGINLCQSIPPNEEFMRANATS